MSASAERIIHFDAPEDAEHKHPDEHLAVHEHSLAHYGVWSLSTTQMVVRFGHGIMWYFYFIKYSLVLNLVLLAIGIASMMPQWLHVPLAFGVTQWTEWFNALFVLTYASSFPTFRGAWLSCVICSAVALAASIPLYGWIVRRYNSQRYLSDDERSVWYHEDPFDGQYDVKHDCVNRTLDDLSWPADREQSSCTPAFAGCCCCARRSPAQIATCGRVCSACLFVLLLTAYGALQYWLQHVAKTELNTAWIHLIMSVVFVLIDGLWTFACIYLTYVECHEYWTWFRKSDFIKSFAFRVCAFMIFMWMEDLAFDSVAASCYRPVEQDCISCQTEYRAQQIVTLIVVDVTLNAAWRALQVVLYSRLSYLLGCVHLSRRPDFEFRQPFDLPYQYVQLIFRQFLISMVMPLTPIAPLFGVLGAMLQWWLDRLKLLRWSRTPERSHTAFLRLIYLFQFVNVAAMFVGYPSGILWLIRDHVICAK